MPVTEWTTHCRLWSKDLSFETSRFWLPHRGLSNDVSLRTDGVSGGGEQAQLSPNAVVTWKTAKRAVQRRCTKSLHWREAVVTSTAMGCQIPPSHHSHRLTQRRTALLSKGSLTDQTNFLVLAHLYKGTTHDPMDKSKRWCYGGHLNRIWETQNDTSG